ncbi:hypothetical protein [Pseudomonas sp. 008]|uniref:hypothetical protein n=1 Tax=Pseudomonas sp. 008 TaxID=2803906 RepID=UPI0019502D8D|nr:hypothetical protein [Pseudomonas sp. 008]GID03086.1 hypothetical protein TMM008_02880 [Pseudomonas sp. 008]
MTPIREVLEVLLGGGFICQYAYPELHRQMRVPEFSQEIAAALAPLGRALGTIGEVETPDTYFARYADLKEPTDRNAASYQLVVIRDQLRPCLEFIRLISRAGRSDICLAPGDVVSFADLLDAIEGHITYRDQLWDLSAHEFFSKSKNAKTIKDRLTLVLRALEDTGYLVKRSSESANFVATGKMGYIYMLLTWLIEFNQIDLDINANTDVGVDQQGGLNL